MLPQITDSEKKAAWLALESTLRRAIKEGDERRLCELLRLLQMGARPLKILLAMPSCCGILHAAVESGSERCLLLLLEAKADPNTVETRNGRLRTPLFLALERNHLTKKPTTLKMMRHLLAHGADTESRSSEIPCTGPQGETGSIMTPLYYAAGMGDLPSLTLLIQARAAVNRVGTGCCTALTVAAEKGATSCVQQLLQSKAHIDHQISGGHTPLWLASSNGSMGVTTLLLKHRAAVNLPANDGCTALCIAVDQLTHELTICSTDNASRKQRLQLITELLRHKADPDSPNAGGFRPLNLAAQRVDVECMQQLLRAGAPINTIGVRGFTALQEASWGYDVDESSSKQDLRKAVTSLLLDADADPLLGADGGALGVASRVGSQRLVKLLLKSDHLGSGVAAVDRVSVALGQAKTCLKEVPPASEPEPVACICLLERKLALLTAVCAECGSHELHQSQQDESQAKKLSLCGNCECTYYCCPEHQRTHWKASHKHECELARLAHSKRSFEHAEYPQLRRRKLVRHWVRRLLPWCAKAGMLLWISVKWWLSVSSALLIITMWLNFVYSFVTTRSGLGGDDSPSDCAYTAVEMGILGVTSITTGGLFDYGWPNSALLLVLAFLLREWEKVGCFWLCFVNIYLLVMKFIMGFNLLDFVHFLVESWS